MEVVKTAMTREELAQELGKHLDDETVKDMIRATDKNGMCAFGVFMVRQARMATDERRKYNLLCLPGAKKVTV